MDLRNVRRDYSLGRLSRENLSNDPLQQFESWLQQVVETEFKDPTAMILATADASGQPNQRYVLLKKFDVEGYVFFTDTSSAKGQELLENPKVSLLFPWHQFERQVRIQGTITRLEKSIVEDYFHSRPLESQQAAACSQQSQLVNSRSDLENQFNEFQQQESIELPKRWGGYIVKPLSYEFWQGGENRLHDRFRYSIKSVKQDSLNQEQQWQIDRLQP